MHQTSKSDLLGCLESLEPQLAALVHGLDPKKSQHTVKTFQEYAQLVFLPQRVGMLHDVV